MGKADKKVKKLYALNVGPEVYGVICKNGKFNESVNDVLLRLLKRKKTSNKLPSKEAV